MSVHWEGDKWTERQRRVFRPILDQSFTIAARTFEDLDLEVPDTIAHVSRLSKYAVFAAACREDGSYGLGVSHHDIWGNRRRSLYHHSRTNTHEWAHIRRLKKFPYDTLIELAATEGLATVVEDSAANRYFSRKTESQLWLEEHSPANLERMRDVFKSTVVGEPYVSATANLWFNVGYLPHGYVLGAWCVYDLLDQGATVAEVIEMSAEEIIGVMA